MRVLGVEGTAWAASAALFDTETGVDDLLLETDPYQPESGGIHPREAAEHMREAVPRVVERVLERDAERGGHPGPTGADTGFDSAPLAAPSDPHGPGVGAGDGAPVDAVAFSRGPGLGPCLRIVGSAARALALTWDVPLVGVNHMVAHLEVGRHCAGFDAPVCLNASGANAHVLAYRGGRYRVLGETMDTGIGNAIDKFARHLGWGHPGGPQVEARAREGSYVDLPYVVKGMDFSFAGLSTAAQAAVDDGVPVADVCFSLQESAFGMLTEVSERALSLTGRNELVLGGGVAQNDRLRGMLAAMCDARGTTLSVPPARFLGDNAGMIAVLGAKMHAAGDTLSVEESAVDPDFRPDQVPVTWDVAEPDPEPAAGTVRGAEAVVEFADETVCKRRLPKPYRHPDLDGRLRRARTVAEARLTHEARRLGVPTPVVFDVDAPERTLVLERVGDADLRDALTPARMRTLGRHLATLHGAGVVHGDPTVRNARVATGRADGTERVWLIDFGLGYHTDDPEDFAMDVHVLRGSVRGTAADPAPLLDALAAAYAERGDPAVLDHLADVEGRGRYRSGPANPADAAD